MLDKCHRRAASKATSGEPKARHASFGRFAQETARLAGRPAAFLIAVAVVLVWAVTGPMFGYSDTWQLVINTGTTIVTFLMVFLIQNTQNRDTLALQIKLAEIIIVMEGTENSYATIEDLGDAELERIHQEFRDRADQVLNSLKQRRSSRSAEQD